MPDELSIIEFDRDGAVAEAQSGLEQLAKEHVTRGGLLKRVGIAGGAVAAATLIPAGIAGARSGGTKKRDVEILNYALTLEYLEAEFYALAVKHGSGFSRKARFFSEVVASHEATHRDALKAVLGSKAIAKPTFDFKHTTRHESTFLKTAQVLEDTGVMAYAGQGPRIHQNAVLAPAGAILAVEARHAAWARKLNGVSPAPLAFQPAKSMSEILAAVKATGFIKS
ncbi:MAG: ferritin-like protein [Solirubrobacteraceae bacterium]|nr:ferritin-like protein [Solirubrobacteraceae bacterium]